MDRKKEKLQRQIRGGERVVSSRREGNDETERTPARERNDSVSTSHSVHDDKI